MITLGFEKGTIIASVVNAKDDADFKINCAILKNQKFRYNPSLRQWEKPAVLYNSDLYDVLRIVTDVYFPNHVKEAILDWPDRLPSELKVEEEIQSIDYEKYSDYKPYVGKHPFEHYQDEDIKRALRQNRFLFAWKMGLGKSYATSIIYEYLKDKKDIQKMILFTSRIGTYNLKSELVKFCKSLKEEDICVINSPKSFKKMKIKRTAFDYEEVYNKKVLIFSYDSWKLIASAYGDTSRNRQTNVPLENFFQGHEWMACFDECHYLSNPKSDRSKLIFRYLKNFKYRYLFSATPADKPEKLYSICLLLDPWLLGYLKYDDWIHKYNDVGTWYSKYAINKAKWHQNDLDLLNQKLSRYSIKRESEDCLDLPKLKVKTFYTPLSEKQGKLYKELANDIVNNMIKKNPDLKSANIDVVREAFSTVMSFIENPLVLAKNESDTVSPDIKEKCAKYNYESDYEKLDIVDAILEDEFENERRGIIWYTHPATKDVLLKKYEHLKPIVIEAELTEEERFAQVEEFKKNESHKILIASQKILASSITINEAKFAIYLETLFSYLDYEQSFGRIYRIGQKDEVHIYHIWYERSVDVFHQIALNTKRDLTKVLFSVKEKPNISLENLRDLFEGKDFTA